MSGVVSGFPTSAPSPGPTTFLAPSTAAPSTAPTPFIRLYPDPLGLQTHLWAWIVGGIFAFLAVVVSLHLIYLHLRENHHKRVRKHVIRILLMVPIYATEAWLGLYLHQYSFWFALARECYESFVIYAFLVFLIEVCGGDAKTVAELEHVKPYKHMFPMCCFKPWPHEGGVWFYKCKYGALQYVPIKLMLAIITFATQITGNYHDGTLAWNDAWPYVAFVQNLSQIWALYCLVFFVHGAPPALKVIRPMRKLIVLKAVVFFTFWQSVAIALCVDLGVIKRSEKWEVDEVSAGLQNFLVCLEMFFAAFAHIWAFPPVEDAVVIPKEHHDGHRSKTGRLVSSLNLYDIGKDVGKMVVHKHKKPPKKTAVVIEEEPDEEEEGGTLNNETRQNETKRNETKPKETNDDE